MKFVDYLSWTVKPLDDFKMARIQPGLFLGRVLGDSRREVQTDEDVRQR